MSSGGWTLEGFIEALEVWEKNEQTPGDLVLIVAAWVMDRHTNPYDGVRREPEFDNLWFGAIPDTYHDGLVVCCSYTIFESEQRVRCDSIASLSWPV